MPTIHFVREDKRLTAPKGANLRDVCRANGIGLYPGHAKLLNCLGHGLCGTCLVFVDDSQGLSLPLTAKEVLKIGKVGDVRYRLACQATVETDLRVLTQPDPPQGWHVHPAYKRMANPEVFEGLPPLSQQLQAETQGEGLAAMDAPAAPPDA